MNRFLFYSPDTYGLGHIRRCSLLAAGLVGASEDNEALIITGSPRAEAFALPERVDTVKLPTVTKDGLGSYQPRKLKGGFDRLIRLRSGLIATAAEAYRPDVIVVDHAPIGAGGELLPMLDLIEEMPRRPKLVLGLRDIIDEAGRTEAAWHREGIWQHLDRYDEILVYGDEAVTTTATELGLSGRTTAKVTHTGYVAPAMPEPTPGEPFLLVTPGGGGDGQGLLRRYLEAVEAGATAGVRSVIVTGPLLSSSRRAELLHRAGRLGSVEVLEFSDQMRSLIASASGVISMAGYNTVVEEMAAGTPALLSPRCAPRLEQHLRAARLAPFAQLQHCALEALKPGRIAAFVEDCTARKPELVDVDLSGVSSVAARLGHLSTPEVEARLIDA